MKNARWKDHVWAFGMRLAGNCSRCITEDNRTHDGHSQLLGTSMTTSFVGHSSLGQNVDEDESPVRIISAHHLFPNFEFGLRVNPEL